MARSSRSALLAVGFATALAAIAATLFLPVAKNAYAVDYVVSDESSCESLPASGGSTAWDPASSTCTLSGELALSGADTLAIASSTTLEILSSGGINSDGSTFGGTINNDGTIVNNGNILDVNAIVNNGVFNNESPLLQVPFSLTNHGTLNNYDDFLTFGSVANHGVVNNYGNVGNTAISAGFVNHPEGIINNYENIGLNHIENQGTINNDVGGSFESYELSGNSGTINNDGSFGINFDFGNSGTINNYGSIQAPFSFPVFLTNSGTINNYGSIDLPTGGTIDNSDGSIVNYCGATFNNLGTFAGNPATFEEACNEMSFAIQESGIARVKDGDDDDDHSQHHTATVALAITGRYECGDNNHVRTVKKSLEGEVTIDGNEYALSHIKIRNDDGVITVKARIQDGGKLAATLTVGQVSLTCTEAPGTELASTDNTLTAKIGKNKYTLIPEKASGSIEFE